MMGGPDKPFAQKVTDMKKERLGNIKETANKINMTDSIDLTYDDLSEKEKLFFEKHGITVEAMRLFLKNDFQHNENQIDGFLPDMSLEEGKEQILGELNALEPRNGKFSHPMELVKAIAKLIKSKMSYDLLFALDSVYWVGRNFGGMEGIVQSVPDGMVDNIVQALKQGGLSLSNEQIEELKNAEGVRKTARTRIN